MLFFPVQYIFFHCLFLLSFLLLLNFPTLFFCYCFHICFMIYFWYHFYYPPPFFYSSHSTGIFTPPPLRFISPVTTLPYRLHCTRLCLPPLLHSRSPHTVPFSHLFTSTAVSSHLSPVITCFPHQLPSSLHLRLLSFRLSSLCYLFFTSSYFSIAHILFFVFSFFLSFT